MLAETIEQLRGVALGSTDASGYFPAMYARVTERIQTAAGEQRFDDADGMVRFARTFAQWYLRPRAGVAPIPSCWQSGWDVAGDGRLLIAQHLFLGMNAHINHDLPQVVVELADGRTDIAGMRSDFDAVNTVLAETMPDVLRDLGGVSRWVNVLAARGGGRLFGFSLQAARNQAWQTAGRLHRLDAEARAQEVTELDRLVTVLDYLITRPAPPFRWLVPVGRRLETRDAVRVTAELLGHLA
jgi:hypothetical protein